MGCHTWFSVPYKTDKEEILKLAQHWLNKADHVSVGHKKMYQYAIENEIIEPVCELASYETDSSHDVETEWILYKDIKNYSIEKYNLENDTTIDKYDDEACKKANIEYYSNEPRIGGYPDVIVKSYKEMVKFMETGFTDAEGKHHAFRYEENRKEAFMEGIKKFFINHPKGIISFG